MFVGDVMVTLACVNELSCARNIILTKDLHNLRGSLHRNYIRI